MMKKESFPRAKEIEQQIKDVEKNIKLLTHEIKSRPGEPNIPVVRFIILRMADTNDNITSDEILKYPTPSREQLDMLTEFYRSSLLIILERERINLEVEFEEL